jgi:pimeloyl-ACP methyl ester carboxylesterase
MPFATAPDGVRIHYEVEGSGPPLVLQHGLLSSLESWRQRGYVERLAPRYQCILVDSRGHGESDKPDDPEAYELRTRVVDVASVLHDAGIETAHYMGYSMGGWIGYGITIYMPQRFRSLTIGGFSPLKPPAVDWEAVAANPALRANPLFARALDEFPHAMRHSMEALRDWRGARQALRLTDLPLLMFAGTADPNESALEMPVVAADAKDATFFAVEGADHTGAADAVDVVAPRVIAFLDRVEAERSAAR